MDRIGSAFLVISLLLFAPLVVNGVETSYIEHGSEAAFKNGDPNELLISSVGEISLSYRTETLISNESDVWVVNDLIKGSDGSLYVATSGAGFIYKISDSQDTEVLYGQGESDHGHVFSLAMTPGGKLLAGTGGAEGHLLMIDQKGKTKTLFTHEDVEYIWDIVVGPSGRIFLATGPKGKVLTMNSKGKDVEELFVAKEKNILSLALDRDGILYAGGDENGLIYRIDPGSQKVTIAFDSQKGEVSGLVFDEKGMLYASTADTKTAKPGAKLILSDGQSDRADESSSEDKVNRKKRQKDNDSQEEESGESDSEKSSAENDTEDPLKLVPPATSGKSSGKGKKPSGGGGAAGGPTKVNEVYQISNEGYVTKLFNKKVIVLSLEYVADGELLIGSGNQGNLMSLDVNTREAVVLHDASPSLQVTSLLADTEGVIYVGCANPGQLFAIEPYFVEQGQFLSEVIDAEQITQWGKLQIEADIPEGASLKVATRSGNTKDPDNGGWQDWTEPINVQEDISIQSRGARFLQYRLDLSSDSGEKTAVVKSVKMAHRWPNMAPEVKNVKIEKTGKNGSSSQWSLKWKGSDENKDQLTYDVFLRMIGKQRWIRLTKEISETKYDFNSLTVADGRYEFKVQACDEISNIKNEAKTHSRISQPIVVDNTPPVVNELDYKLDNDSVYIRMELTDSFSVIGDVKYTVNSSDQWRKVIASDGVYDSRHESVVFDVDLEEPGEHFIAIKISDASGNVMHKNITVDHTP